MHCWLVGRNACILCVLQNLHFVECFSFKVLANTKQPIQTGHNMEELLALGIFDGNPCCHAGVMLLQY